MENVQNFGFVWYIALDRASALSISMELLRWMKRFFRLCLDLGFMEVLPSANPRSKHDFSPWTRNNLKVEGECIYTDVHRRREFYF